MRLSTNENDPGYKEYIRVCRKYNFNVLVLVDGEELMCETADSDEGYVLVFDRAENGKYRSDVHGNELTKVVYGDVKIYLGWKCRLMNWWMSKWTK